MTHEQEFDICRIKSENKKLFSKILNFKDGTANAKLFYKRNVWKSVLNCKWQTIMMMMKMNDVNDKNLKLCKTVIG